MQDLRKRIATWAGAVGSLAGALAALLQSVRSVLIVIAVAAFVVLFATGGPDIGAWLAGRRRAAVTSLRRRRPAYTARWRPTTEGLEVPAVMTTLQKSFFHPALQHPAGGEPPTVRVAALVACEPLGDDPATEDLRRAFTDFLGAPPITDLVAQLTTVGAGATWHCYASNGRLSNGAVLTGGDPDGPPVAAALLNLRDSGTRQWVHDRRYAELLITVEPRASGGQPAGPASLVSWCERLLVAFEVPGAFAAFLHDRLRARTHADAPAQLGVRLDARPSLRHLVDTTGLSPLAGSQPTSQFLSYAIADPSALPARGAAVAILGVWCDHALAVDGYGAELTRLAVPSTRSV